MKLDIDWLIGFQRAQFNKSSSWRIKAMIMQFVIGLLALLSVFLDDHNALYLISTLTALFIIILFGCTYLQRASRDTAESARRASVLIGGLGLDLPAEILQEMWTEGAVSDEEVNASRDNRYYGSREDPGPKRLYEILHQSVVWTAFFQRKSATIAWTLFAVSLTLALTVLLVATAYADHAILVSVGRAVLVIATFVLTQGLFDSAMGHHGAAVAASKIKGRLSAIKAKTYPIGELLHALMDYNSAVECAPLVFPLVYRRYRDRLNEQWANDDYDLGEVRNPFGLGLEQNVNRLSEPNPLWRQAFDEEAGRIAAGLGAHALAIEHYGSTAVPGLSAKPIIDMLVGIADIDDAQLLIEPMRALGYDYLGAQGIADHHLFGKGKTRTHLAHVIVHQGGLWRKCLAFRDRLQSDGAVRRAYEMLKRELAAVQGMTREEYTAGKTQFIEDVLEGRWSPE